ncbi:MULTISPECIES: CPBP family intramembrane glutamic endopeptidase [Brevibacterium]|uniref:CAAX prenyl protease 2/Lysostaphin resistance protein A-like domain-containing protein n=1 Tax=Brevibacterium ammoniilyticum TaxID=1046555 RepID=A0ABP9U544_9MICO
MTSPSSVTESGRPWALTILWIVLMAPLSLAGTALQPLTPIPYEVFPLVMIGPALAALICRLVVPSWFPAPEETAPKARYLRAIGGTVIASIAFIAVLVALLEGGNPALPVGWAPVLGVIAVIIGLSLGGLLEEIGYRGVMYRALATRMGPVLAIIINGVFFGLCHLQYFGAGLLAVVLFVLSTVFMDVVMVALWTGSWNQRVMVATLFHGVVNVALALIGDPMTSLRAFAVLALATGIAALVAVPLGRRLGVGDLRSPARQPASQPT